MAHGKNNRRRGHVKITRRTKPRKKFINSFVGHQDMQKVWDNSLTTKQNYEKMGFKSDSNPSLAKDKEEEEVQFFDVPDSDILKNERNYNKKPNHMSEEEIKYLRPLIEKYEDDFKQMERDIKVNAQQWTASKLKRRIARLKLLDAKAL